jgi:hypothetical protein
VYDRMPIWALYASLCKKDGRSRPSGEPNIHSPPSLPRRHVCAPLGVCTAAGRQWPLTTGAPTEPIAALGHPPGSRPGCGPVQKACRPTALRSVRHQRAWSTASHLVGRVQACPLTSAQSGFAVFDRPHVLDYCCLLWAMLETGLPTTAPAGPRNGVDTHLVRSSQALGNRELTVCPSLACALLPYSGGAKERAPTMPCHPCRWAGLAPNCPLAQS